MAIFKLQRNAAFEHGAKQKWNKSITISVRVISTGLHMISKHSLKL
jgi:hypothetical protein